MTRHVLRWGQSAHETDADLAGEAEAAARVGATWSCHPHRDPPALRDVWAVVVNSGVRVTATELRDLAGRFLLTTTSGFDHIDLEAARACGVTVARCPEARGAAVAEFTLGATISAIRRLDDVWGPAAEGRWARGELPAIGPCTLDGARVVVVGAAGVIGARVRRLFEAFGATVLPVDPRLPAGLDLDEVLGDADVVSLHCDLNPSTRALFDADRLARLSPRTILLNTARGESLDVAAAVGAVADGRLGALICDVFPTEPYPALSAATHPRIRFSPHGAGYTRALGGRVAIEVGRALDAWATGREVPYTLVNGR